MTAPVITCDRHRLTTDGEGVTTLVCFHGCPLRCRYCINPFSFAPDTRKTDMTPQMLYEKVKVDELYFLATGGGVTFGGGEPLLYPDFLNEFRGICGTEWHLCAETSLNVQWESVRKAAECIDVFYVDIKDINPDIYRRYTGQENDVVLDNLKQLVDMIGTERIVVRLPRIPEFNTDEDRDSSQGQLMELGLTQFDRFDYKRVEQNK